MERIVGLKWTAWLGALIFVIGSGLGIKFAYDQGWLRGIPPEARWSLMMLAALAFLPAGEWAYRKVNRLASVGLFATGIALCFVVSYAGQAYYDIYGRNTAFVLMAASAVIGAAISIRGDMVSIAIVALLGAHGTPLVVGGEPNLRGFLIYLFALHLLALVLAGRGSGHGGGKWWLLRGLSLAASALWTIALTLATNDLPWEAVLFSAAVAVIAHMELAYAAARPRSAPSIATAHAAGARTYAILLSAFPALTVGILYHGDDIRILYFAAAASAALAATAWLMRYLATPNNITDQHTPRLSALLALDDVYRLKAISLLALGITGGLSGDTETAAYTGLGLILAIFAVVAPTPAHIRRTYASTFGLLLPLVTLARCTQDLARLYANTSADPVRTSFAGLNWLPAAAKLAAAALASQVTAYLTVLPKSLKLAPPVIKPAVLLTSAVATAGLVTALFVLASPSAGVVFIVLAASVWAALGLYQPGWIGRLYPLHHAWALLTIASFFWLIFVAVGPRLERNYTPADVLPLFNPVALSGLLCGIAIYGLAWCIRRFRPPSPEQDLANRGIPMVLAFSAALLMALCVGHTEIDRIIGEADQFFSVHADLARVLIGTTFTTLCIAAWSTTIRRLAESTLANSLIAAAAGITMFFCCVTALAAALTLGRPLANVANLPVVASLIVAACSLYHAHALRAGPTVACAGSGIFAGGLLLSLGSVEIIRLPLSVTRFDLPHHLVTLNLLGLWGLAFGLAFGAAAHRFARNWVGYRAYLTAAAGTLLTAAVFSMFLAQWLVWITGEWPRPLLILNIQTASGALTIAALFALHWLWQHRWQPERAPPSLKFIRVSACIIVANIFFVASSCDVARLLIDLTTARPGSRLISTGYSVWWAILALLTIAAGFRFKLAAARYTGLALFGLTLLKVVFVDLSDASQGWRILSFLALGALLLATSLLYGKLAPILLDSDPPAPIDPPVDKPPTDTPPSAQV
jgi:uncharacterized membrane protein